MSKPSVKMTLLDHCTIDVSEWDFEFDKLEDHFRKHFNKIVARAVNDVLSEALREDCFAIFDYGEWSKDPPVPPSDPLRIQICLPFETGTLENPWWSFSLAELIEQTIDGDCSLNELILIRDRMIEMCKAVQLKILREERWRTIEETLDAQEQ